MLKPLTLPLYLLALVSLIAIMLSESHSRQDVHYSDYVAVLTYHHIDPQESAYTVSPQRFAAQLQALQANHYHVIPVEQFIAFLQGKSNVPPNAVVITFDDGYESFYRYAYPALKKLNMTATDFLIVSYIGQTSLKPPILNWDEILKMKSAGFSFYSHTYNSHRSLTDQQGRETFPLTDRLYNPKEHRYETEQEYEQRVLTDLTTAESILKKKLGNRLSLLCFPHGIYNSEVVRLAEQAGIHYFFTGKEGFNSNRAQMIKRINVGSPNITPDILIRKLTIPSHSFVWKLASKLRP